MTGSARLKVVGGLVALAMIVSLFPAAAALCAEPSGRFIAPVNGPIIRKFDPPASRFSSGHRGIDFGVGAGTPVKASNAGVVTFAGPVGGDGLFVTIRHDQSLETTYSFMSQVDVKPGQSVGRGRVIGLSGAGHPGGRESLHFGAKVNGNYIDPELLLSGDPKDISQALSLAPLPEHPSGHGSGAGGGDGSLGGGKALGPLDQGEDRESSDSPGFFIEAGRKLAGFGDVLLRGSRAARKLASSAIEGVKKLPEGLRRGLGDLREWAGAGFNRLKSSAIDGWNHIGQAAAGGWSKVKQAALDGFDDLRSQARESWRKFKSIPKKIGAFIRLTKKAAGKAVELAKRGLKKMKGFIASIPEKIGNQWRSVKRLIKLLPKSLGWAWKSFKSAMKSAGAWTKRSFSSFVKWTKTSFKKLVTWTKSTAKKVASWMKKIVRGASFLAKRALQRTAFFLRKTFELARTLLRKVARGIAWLGRQMWRAVRFAWEGIRQWFSRVVRSTGRLLGTLGGIVKATAVFPFAMAKGLIDEVKCQMEGGGRAPKIPTRQQMRKGVKAPPPPNDNIVIAVAGIGSRSYVDKNGKVQSRATLYSMDYFKSLGYSDTSIYFYSYRGAEQSGGDGPFAFHQPYNKEDTYQEIWYSALLLDRQVKVIQARHPGKKVDIVAHSQGGVVAQAYLALKARGSDSDRAALDHFVTFGSPHTGADGAGLYESLSGSKTGNLALQWLAREGDKWGFPPPTAPSARNLDADSDLIREINVGWNPRRIKTTTIAATYDYVVPAPRTRLQGARHFTADLEIKDTLNSHSAIVDSEHGKGVLYNALRDVASVCTALANAFADAGPGRAISLAEEFVINSLGLVVSVMP